MENKTETSQTKKRLSKPRINIPILKKSELKIMFICNGNICCSQMAEFIMKYLVNSEDLSNRVTITSSGCFADPEEIIDPGAVKELHKHQIPFIKKNAVQFDESIGNKYDYIICMAQEQIRTLSKGRRNNKLYLLMDFAGEHRNIFDPIFNGRYSEAYSMIYRGCTALLDHLKKTFANNPVANKSAKKTILNVSVDEDLLLRFEAALMLKHDTIEFVLEKFMNNYTNAAAKILAGSNSKKNFKSPQIRNSQLNNKVENDQNTSNEAAEPINESEVIEQFIKKWASGVNQINYRIIKSYFKAIELNGTATVDSMKELCSNQKEYPGLYIYKNNGFDNHYRQLKTSSVVNGKIKKGKNIDGKIFWEDNQEVKILIDVEPFLEKYKSYFIN